MIESDEALEILLPLLGEADRIALDTEADSLHAYPEKLCLIQISMAAQDELIDPLAGFSLGPLWPVLQEKLLVLHGADYDLRLLWKTFSFVPERVFDTMLAARLVGHTEFGLGHLVSHYLGVTLKKGAQKANWAKRPLTQRMIDYAHNDTRYLLPLADNLQKELKSRDRLEWHQEVCRRLIKECSQTRKPNPDQVWRLKGSDRLDRSGLAVLRELWLWREKEAVRSNRPPYFILGHERMVEIAGAVSSGKPLPSLSLTARRENGVKAAIERALALPEEKRPERQRSKVRRLSPEERGRVQLLQEQRDRKARELEIDPTLIASRSTLLDLAQDWENASCSLMDWQRKLVEPVA